MLLTNFEEMIPGCDKPFPGLQVGPEELWEEDDDLGEMEHFPHGEDELLGFLGDHLTHAAHTGFKKH